MTWHHDVLTPSQDGYAHSKGEAQQPLCTVRPEGPAACCGKEETWSRQGGFWQSPHCLEWKRRVMVSLPLCAEEVGPRWEPLQPRMEEADHGRVPVALHRRGGSWWRISIASYTVKAGPGIPAVLCRGDWSQGSAHHRGGIPQFWPFGAIHRVALDR